MNKIQYFIVALILGAFVTTGFQCASPEMSTARVAKQGGDLEKALTYYEKALAKDPNNSDAMYEEAQVYLKKATSGDPQAIFKATELTVKAKDIASKAVKKSATAAKNEQTEYDVWVYAFNFGTQMLNQLDQAGDNKAALGAKAVELFEGCAKINPTNPDNFTRLGITYEMLDDNDKAAESFAKYNNYLKKEIDFVTSKNMHVGQNPNDVIEILGKPEKTYMCSQYLDPRVKTAQDTMNILFYKVDGEKFAVYTRYNSKTNVTGVTGWRFNPTTLYQTNPFDFDVTATAELAKVAFDKKDYDKAAAEVQTLKALDPTNVSANQFLIQILEAQGSPEKAVAALEKLVKENPNDPVYRAQYGDILNRQKNYDGAITQYEAAINNYENNYKGSDKKARINEIKRILGSTYKNKAVAIQSAEFDKHDKDANYKINTDAYLPVLSKSKSIFEDLTKEKEFSNNYIILLELADIYIATNESDKLTSTLTKLDKVKDDVPTEDMEFFLVNMIKYYDVTKNAAKLDEYNKLYEAYKK